MSDPLAPILDATACDVAGPIGGSYFAVDRGACIEYQWIGEGSSRQAHAALARVLAAEGIKALGAPGTGVWVEKSAVDPAPR